MGFFFFTRKHKIRLFPLLGGIGSISFHICVGRKVLVHVFDDLSAERHHFDQEPDRWTQILSSSQVFSTQRKIERQLNYYELRAIRITPPDAHRQSIRSSRWIKPESGPSLWDVYLNIGAVYSTVNCGLSL